jgi:hypothetical protein
VAATKLLETQTQELPKETEINQQNANTNRYRAEIENLNGQANRADLLQKRIDFQHKVVSNMAQTWINEHGDNPTTPEAIQDYETMHGFVSPLLGTDGYPDPKTMDPIKAKQLPGYIGMIAAQANDVKDQIDQKAAKITAQKDEYLARGEKYDVNGNPIKDPVTGETVISEDRYEADLKAQVDRERIAMERAKAEKEKEKKPLSVPAAKSIANLGIFNKNLYVLENALAGDDVSVFNRTPLGAFIDPKVSTAIRNIDEMYARPLSGAAINKKEWKTFRSEILSRRNLITPEGQNAALENIRDFISRNNYEGFKMTNSETWYDDYLSTTDSQAKQQQQSGASTGVVKSNPQLERARRVVASKEATPTQRKNAQAFIDAHGGK